MTPTTTKAGGSISVRVPAPVAGQDTWTLTDLSGAVVGTGSLSATEVFDVEDLTVVDSDTVQIVVESEAPTGLTPERHLMGTGAAGETWEAWIVGVSAESETEGEGEGAVTVYTTTVTLDRAVGPTPVSVWSPWVTVAVPACDDYGLLSLAISHSGEAWTSAVEIVRSPLALRVTAGDVLAAFPTLAKYRSLFTSPSQWAGMVGKAQDLVDQEIRRRGDRTRLLLGDAQVRPALVEAMRFVLAENDAYGEGEANYPLESQKKYRDRMISACDALFGEAAFRTEGSETQANRTSWRTYRSTR